MTELKTKKNNKDVLEFLSGVLPEKRRLDSLKLLEGMNEVLGIRPSMWGDSIIGYGSYHYKTRSGREADWFVTGFSPRKTSLTIYIMPGIDAYLERVNCLGKVKLGKGCIYINKLEDVDWRALMDLVSEVYSDMERRSFMVEV